MLRRGCRTASSTSTTWSPCPGILTWRPVRATLGIRAFGTNAYTAAEAEALAALRLAIDREPELRDAAREDDDFAGLRDDPDFVAVVTR